MGPHAAALLLFATFVVVPCTGFLGVNTCSHNAKWISRPACVPRPPSSRVSVMVLTPAQMVLQLDGLQNFAVGNPEVASTNNSTTTQNWEVPKVKAQKAPCSSLYGTWRDFSSPAPVPTRDDNLATGRFLTTPEKRAVRSGVRGRPRTKPLVSVKEELLDVFIEKAYAVLKANGGKIDSNVFGQHWKNIHDTVELPSFKSHKSVTIHSMMAQCPEHFIVKDTNRQKVKVFELVPGAKLTKIVAPPSPENASTTASTDSQTGTAAGGSATAASPQPQSTMGRPKGLRVVGMQPIAPVGDAPLQEANSNFVPAHGKARNSLAFDRRGKKTRKMFSRANMDLSLEEVPPPEPVRCANDAVKGAVTAMYNSWAMDGRDVVMEATHSACVDQMLEIVEQHVEEGKPFTAIDAGCGNGWAARRMARNERCVGVVGVDGAEKMIERAHELDEEELADYLVENVQAWTPDEPVDVVFANELLYFLEAPAQSIAHISKEWLRPGGLFIASLDCYKENKLCHTWASDLRVPLHCLSETEWAQYFEDAGLTDVECTRSSAPGPWAGTLIVKGTKTRK